MNKSALMHGGSKILAVMLMLGLGACASPYVNITEQDRTGVRNAKVIYMVRYVSQPPYIQTPKEVVGVGLMASATDTQKLPSGGILASKYGYPEPTQLVASRLAEQLRTRGRMQNLSMVATAEPLPVKDDFGQYRSRYATGIVLEINMSGGYMLSYQPMNWKTYQFVPFGIRARMIDPKDGRMLWSTYCNIGSASGAKLTIDVSEFEANNGAAAKKVIQTAAQICADQLADSILGSDQLKGSGSN